MKKWISARRAVVAMFVLAIAATISFASLQNASAGGGIGLERAIAAQEAHNPQLLSITGVVGTGVNPGNGNILVMTERDGIAGIPSSLDGVPVQRVVTGKINALHHCKGGHASAPECDPPSTPTPTPTPTPGGPTPTPTLTPVVGDPRDTFLPIVPNGVSIGHYAITAGTLGVVVTTDGIDRLVLSNNHVLADENGADINDLIMQAGPYDNGCYPICSADAAYNFGTLVNFHPIDFSGGNNVVDAAIAAPGTGITLTNATLSDGYGSPSGAIVDWQNLNFRQKVQKYGRTTGQTEGRVFGVNVTVNVGYDSGVARFVKQIWVRGSGFSAGGDSGSLVVTTNGRPVGLLFAGGGNDTFINPIQDVVDTLGVSIVTQ